MMHGSTKVKAEEEWSLPQYSFLEGSRKTGSLTCRSEDWIQSQMQAVADLSWR